MNKHTKDFMAHELIEDTQISFDSICDILGCEDCKDKHGFTVPQSLIRDVLDGNVVVFAGSGISTERRTVIPWTLHEEICKGLNLDNKTVLFPDAIETFVSLPNGRIRLIQKILERFDYIESFAELRNEACEFHDILATMYFIDTIITTNWDTYFERRCACQPFVLDLDMGFWDSAKRRVLKIHGSVENLGTIVATRSDYTRCQNELHKSLVGSRLKTLLTTKTVIFFGYSLRDDDFVEIMKFVKQSLGAFTRQHYIVTLDKDNESVDRYKKYGLVPICTDAIHFLQNIKDHIVTVSCTTPDTVYSHAAHVLQKLKRAHIRLYDRIEISEYPEVIYCACYQDGLMHNLERVVDSRSSGAYSDLHSVQIKLEAYRDLRAEKIKARKYDDVAYIDGYLTGFYLAFVHGREPKFSPDFYYIFGRTPRVVRRIEDYTVVLKQMRRRGEHHKCALARAKKLAKRLASLGSTPLVYHHKCQLL